MRRMSAIVLMAVLLAPVLALAQASARGGPDNAKADANGLLPPIWTSGYFQGRLLHRIGDDPELRPPQVISAPDPPPLKDFRPGTVILWCVVDNEGKIHLISVARHLSKEADTLAVENLRQWKFKPAKLKKDDVDVQMTVDIVWH